MSSLDSKKLANNSRQKDCRFNWPWKFPPCKMPRFEASFGGNGRTVLSYGHRTSSQFEGVINWQAFSMVSTQTRQNMVENHVEFLVSRESLTSILDLWHIGGGPG